MLKTINNHIFDVAAGFAIVVTVFYLAAITDIMPLPDGVSTRIAESSLNVMDVLLACVAWLMSFLPSVS